MLRYEAEHLNEQLGLGRSISTSKDDLHGRGPTMAPNITCHEQHNHSGEQFVRHQALSQEQWARLGRPSKASIYHPQHGNKEPYGTILCPAMLVKEASGSHSRRVSVNRASESRAGARRHPKALMGDPDVYERSQCALRTSHNTYSSVQV